MPHAVTPELLDRELPPPEELLARGGLPPRTVNALRRYLARVPFSVEPWTFRRLLAIRGVGPRALTGVALALDGHVPPATPWLARAIAVVAASLPATGAELAERLRAARVGDGLAALRRIERSGISLPFAVLRRPRLVLAVPRHQLAQAVRIHRALGRGLRRFGLLSVAFARFVGRTRSTLVTHVAAAHDGFRWLDDERQWFWLSNSGSRLVRAIERCVGGAELRVADVAREVFRSWPEEVVPPLHVLAELCRQTPQLTVERLRVRLRR